ncbi:MAG: tyrosine--tRNA ligase [Chloroflexota bacterium]
MNVIQDLQWRGALYDVTPNAEHLFENENVTVYAGFDPTAKSLHIGNLVPIMGLVRMQRHGHSPIAIVGGGTGMIGDPSGKAEERQLMTAAQVDENVEGIGAQLGRFLDFNTKKNPAKLVNNADWLLQLGLVDFLRDVGKHFTVNYMMAKESVAARLDRDEGLSYTEFSYMLLQAYDFLVLHDRYNCRAQLGGSDQWGNILAGVELIRRMRGERAHAVVYPLITTSTGEKFGKSVGGAPTLDPEETSPFRFFQFWMNVADADVIRYMKLFTLWDGEQIAPYEEAVSAEPQKREAQRALAKEMTEIVHGKDGLARAERATNVLFGGSIEGIPADELLDIFSDVPSRDLPRTEFEDGGLPVSRLLVAAGVAESNGEARRLVQGGGIYLNNQRVSDPRDVVTAEQLADGRVLVLRRGAKNYHLVRVV